MDNKDELDLPAAPSRLLRLSWATEGTAAGNNAQQRKETTP